MKARYPLALSVLAYLLASPAAWACATCFGRSDSPMAKGMNMGILFLLGVIGAVLVAFASFFIFLARRATAGEKPGALTPSATPS